MGNEQTMRDRLGCGTVVACATVVAILMLPVIVAMSSVGIATKVSVDPVLVLVFQEAPLSSLEELLNDWDLNELDTRLVGDQPLLIQAANYGRSDLIHYLLARGANPNVRRAPEGFTALHLAVIHSNRECVQALLCGGADPSLRGRYGGLPSPIRGRLPIDLAVEVSDRKIVNMLEGAMSGHLPCQGHCQCGYDLRASTGSCPECGEPIPEDVEKAAKAKAES